MGCVAHLGAGAPDLQRVAVIVVTHTSDPSLSHCLVGIRAMLQQPEDLIFVDNGSSEAIGGWVAHHFPGTTVLRLDHNTLFCGGYNAGIRLAIERKYDFALILNADTDVTNCGFLSQLLNVAHRWPRAAFIGPLVYWRSKNVVQKTCLEFPKILRNVLIWLPWRIARGYFEKQPDVECEVEFLNGVCVLCRIKALREIGLLDEAFGGYVEDADWSWRARQIGWKSVYSPIPSVIHHEAAIGYEPYSFKTFLLKRNTVYWYMKIGGRVSAVIYAMAALTLAWTRMISTASKGERNKHRYFVEKLYRAYRGLFLGETPGIWFGPPFASWADTPRTSKQD